MMPFNERPEPGLPQDIRQAGVAMQLVIRLDQTPALRGQALRQKPEIRALGGVDESRITDACRNICVARNPCHDIHRFAPRWARGTRPMQRSITIPDIYLRWRVTVILIEKKYTELRKVASNATKQIASAHHVWRKRHN